SYHPFPPLPIPWWPPLTSISIPCGCSTSSGRPFLSSPPPARGLTCSPHCLLSPARSRTPHPLPPHHRPAHPLPLPTTLRRRLLSPHNLALPLTPSVFPRSTLPSPYTCPSADPDAS
uniref:Uncharacterized protein n=1 Tax=Triticum urartu TaxID=4572 RepID=A0A8R7TFW9_TRIUA